VNRRRHLAASLALATAGVLALGLLWLVLTLGLRLAG